VSRFSTRDRWRQLCRALGFDQHPGLTGISRKVCRYLTAHEDRTKCLTRHCNQCYRQQTLTPLRAGVIVR
jgi:hypothetical protein